MAHVKKDDLVLVITGSDKGKSGKIIEIDLKHDRVKVQGVGLVHKHYKARKQGEKSSIRVFERYIHSSNVKKIVS